MGLFEALKKGDLITGADDWPYRGSGLRVVGKDGDDLIAHPDGGGMQYRIRRGAVDARFRRVDEASEILPWRAGKFTVGDEPEPSYEGFENGRAWNGWSMPCFVRDVAERILGDAAPVSGDDHGWSWRYEAATDSIRYWQPNCDGSPNVDGAYYEAKGFDITVDGVTHHVYQIGDGWTWRIEDGTGKGEDIV